MRGDVNPVNWRRNKKPRILLKTHDVKGVYIYSKKN